MKKTVLGLCIGLIIGLSTNAFAAIGDIVEAQFAKFDIVVDGEKKELSADPLVYQGSTYLPVRTVANLVGKDVVYKADSRTIELNTPETEALTLSENAQIQEDVAKQIAELNNRIEALKGKVKSTEIAKRMYDSEEDKQAMQDSIDKTNAAIAELEAKKSQLESQQQLQE